MGQSHWRCCASVWTILDCAWRAMTIHQPWHGLIVPIYEGTSLPRDGGPGKNFNTFKNKGNRSLPTSSPSGSLDACSSKSRKHERWKAIPLGLQVSVRDCKPGRGSPNQCADRLQWICNPLIAGSTREPAREGRRPMRLDCFHFWTWSSLIGLLVISCKLSESTPSRDEADRWCNLGQTPW